MSKQYYYRPTGQWLDQEDYLFMMAKPTQARSPLSAPMVMCDTIDHTQSMVDGQYYDSKAKLRQTYLPSGNKQGERFVEVGNEPQQRIMRPGKPDKKGIEAAIGRAASRVGIGAF
jgi:hypothetical protein